MMPKSKKAPEQEFKMGMGWPPDLPDARDFMFAPSPKILRKLPLNIDLRSGTPPIYNQGGLGSCTANALCGAFQYGQKKQGHSTFMPSRLFLYYNERVPINTVGSDSGAFLRDGIKSLEKDGVCPEKEWSYDDDDAPGAKYSQKPPQKCYKDALKSQITSYMRLTHNLTSFKSCLAEKFPFVFGFTVYESFMGNEVRTTGIMPLPRPSEKVRGGHAVMAVGFDDAQQAVLVRNSWGTGWGIKGHFWMPYAYIADPHLCDDFWTIRVVE
ncbi:MAG: C1 family peptidase [Chitinophagaceae bacterium]